jgi:hypothetical protein
LSLYLRAGAAESPPSVEGCPPSTELTATD